MLFRSGSPVPEATVRILDDRSGAGVAETQTDEGGRYELRVPPGERYRISALKLSRVGRVWRSRSHPLTVKGAELEVNLSDMPDATP